MKKIVIIHFNPLELYPPVQNEIVDLAGYTNKKIYVISTAVTNKGLSAFRSPAENIRIIRLGTFSTGMGALSRYMNFIFFYTGSLYYLVVKRPARVLYYETLSSFPVFLYKKFFNRNAALFIHYHEYTSAEEHSTGTKLLKFFHRYEKKLYPEATWVSHTNEYRMAKFEDDISPVTVSKKRILPNYPPRGWYTPAKLTIQKPVKVIYVGALSLHTMFTKEFAGWIAKQDGAINWDIYSYNIDEEVYTYLKELQCPFINIKGAVNYQELPQILKHYDVGIVLYKGHIPNYVYNAPNKLFEYLACGLDVWFPSVMTGSLPYVTKQSYPKVIALDFTDLHHFDLQEAMDRKGFTLQSDSFFCEDALKALNTQLSGSDG